MRLLLVRHGQTDSNVAKALDTGHPGAPLNALGTLQAEALPGTLSSEPITAIYSSDLTRAMQTAAPLARARGIEPVALPGFREIYAGTHDMSTDWRPYVEVMYRWSDDPAACLPGAESWVDFEKRWTDALAHVEAAGDACVVIVSHGAAMSVWVPWAASNLRPGDAAGWPLPNTSVLVLEGSTSDGWTLLDWPGVELPVR